MSKPTVNSSTTPLQDMDALIEQIRAFLEKLKLRYRNLENCPDTNKKRFLKKEIEREEKLLELAYATREVLQDSENRKGNK